MRADTVSCLPSPPPFEEGESLFARPTVRYAGWWRRVGGATIDSMILGVTTNIAVAVIGGTGSVLVAIVAGLVITAGYLGYFVLLNANGQQTIGRRVLGTRVTRESGEDLSYGLAALRLLASVLSWFTFGLGVLWPLWDDKNQTFHDKVAMTIVIKT